MSVKIERILELLSEAGSQAQWCLALNERQFVGTPSLLVERVGTLKAHGVQLAIGDVGAGRGTLDSVILLEPKYVKVPARLVRGVAADAQKARYLERIIKLVDVLGSQLIAGGVDQSDDRVFLERLGVPFAQGALWSL